jgi:hypothetical protein
MLSEALEVPFEFESDSSTATVVPGSEYGRMKL